jgi:hypothetical protein
MHKQELRKHADPGLHFSPGHGLLHTEVIDYIVRTAVKNIAGQRILAVYLYDRQNVSAPRYTIFQTQHEYSTLMRAEGGALQWRSACLSSLLSGWPRKQCAFYTQKDQQRVTQFCALEDESGVKALTALQEKIMAVRQRKHVITRERKIIETMRRVPNKPRDLAGWIHREVLPAHVFYTYRKGGKAMEGWCSACRHDVQVVGAHHNAVGHCPRCGRAITFKAAGKIGRLYDHATAQVIQRTGESEFLVRIFKAYKSYRGNYRNAKEEIWESARFFVRWDGGEISVDPYYHSYKGVTTHWHSGVRPIINKWTQNFGADICGHLYLRNLNDALLGTPWQYSQLQHFYEHDREPLEVLPYLQRFVQYPFIEYFVKLSLHKLAQHMVYTSYPNSDFNVDGHGLQEILGVPQGDLPLLQTLDASPKQLKLLRALHKQGLRSDESLLRWYATHEIADQDNILRPLHHMPPGKLMRYIDRQFERLRDTKTKYGAQRYRDLRSVLSEYCDYLRICAALCYDLRNTFVLFPRDLCAAHDAAASQFQAKKDEATEKAIGAAYSALAERYGYSHGEFAILAPKTAKEITEEGHALRHCVGSYAERVVKDECVILFLRRLDNLAAPFVTLELKGGQLVQNRGFSNGEPSAEAKAFLQRWERDVLQAAPQKLAA